MKVKLVPISTLNVNSLNSDEYIKALNNPECNKYLEIRFKPQTYDTVKEYIETLPDNVRFFKIIGTEKVKSDPPDVRPSMSYANTWVGNIKLGPINMWHRFAEIGILIFPAYWNKGYGSEAIKLISDYSFNIINLHRIFAGCLEPNINSIKAFKNAGFSEEYRIKNQYFVNNGKYVDDIVLSKRSIE